MSIQKYFTCSIATIFTTGNEQSFHDFSLWRRIRNVLFNKKARRL